MGDRVYLSAFDRTTKVYECDGIEFRARLLHYHPTQRWTGTVSLLDCGDPEHLRDEGEAVFVWNDTKQRWDVWEITMALVQMTPEGYQ
tara:strand:- start:774 stop:1037 length:264 start_codon:yes stop_codon:yes gene_type:complete